MTPDDRIILICAFRYALGRMTYAVGTVAERIERDWSLLTPGDRETIHRDIRGAIERGHAGMDCDVRAWSRLLELPTT